MKNTSSNAFVSSSSVSSSSGKSGTFSHEKGSNKKGPGLLLISVGSMLTSMVAAGFLLGYGVDVVLDTQPIFFLSLGLLGFVGGIMKVYKILTAPELH